MFASLVRGQCVPREVPGPSGVWRASKSGTDVGKGPRAISVEADLEWTYQRMFPMWLMSSFLFPEKMPDTVPSAGSRLSGLVGLMSACGAGINRGRKIHFDSVDTWAFASTEPSPKMARKPTMSSWRALRSMDPSFPGCSQWNNLIVLAMQF